MTAPTLIAAIIVGLASPTGQSPRSADDPPGADTRPVAVFAELDGTWVGTFAGYDAGGKELYRIHVEQTYETIDANTQRVTVKDTMPDGTVITGRGTNTAHRDRNGGLVLKCIVEKSEGDRVEHRGREIRGMDGRRQLIWSSDRPGRTETFREVVRQACGVNSGETIYEINGMGRYGGTLMLMHGRYVKQKARSDEGRANDTGHRPAEEEDQKPHEAFDAERHEEVHEASRQAR